MVNTTLRSHSNLWTAVIVALIVCLIRPNYLLRCRPDSPRHAKWTTLSLILPYAMIISVCLEISWSRLQFSHCPHTHPLSSLSALVPVNSPNYILMFGFLWVSRDRCLLFRKPKLSSTARLQTIRLHQKCCKIILIHNNNTVKLN